MVLSSRESARILAEAGIARTQAQVLLAAGLAGCGVRTAGAVLYDERAVRALAMRPLVDSEVLHAACPHGLYLTRLERARRLDTTTGWASLADQLSVQPPMPSLTRALLSAQITVYETLPWVATLCGYVVLGADATRVDAAPDGSTVFELMPPSAWFDPVAERVFASSRGGRPWVVWRPRQAPPLSGRRG
jgi:hypothetical protein